jgi:hypothetical protein
MRRTALTLLLLAAACGRAPSPAPAHPDAAAEGGDRVILERGPCFGVCPVYTVTLQRSGAVRFEGHRFVADTGVSIGAVPVARAESLFRAIDAAGFFDFEDRYAMGDPGCGRYATDLPVVVTELRLAGRSKRVAHDHGCADAPAALATIESRIDTVAGVRRWLGK